MEINRTYKELAQRSSDGVEVVQRIAYTAEITATRTEVLAA